LAGEPTGLPDSGTCLRWPETFAAQEARGSRRNRNPAKQLRSDSQRLLPGTILTRIYDDVEHRVLVRGSNDFEYQGQRFKSLSAIAGHITGSHWSGPVFFGHKSPASKKVMA